VLTIIRTYRTSERPVETADIVLPVERYALVYEIPVTKLPPGGGGLVTSVPGHGTFVMER
jgi:hypothetical protein